MRRLGMVAVTLCLGGCFETRCISNGYKPGTADMAVCIADKKVRFNMMLDGMGAAADQDTPILPPPSRPVMCQRAGMMVICN